MAARKQTTQEGAARTFDQVLADELDAIHARRARCAGRDALVESSEASESSKAVEPGDGTEIATPIARAHRAELVGLAFSGGGIRSATVNLGVASALARRGLLRRFDYLSANSGGGYIGGWLLAWIKRQGFATVERSLAGAPPPASAATGAASTPHEPPPVSFLRAFSNYLTPKVGLFAADTWTLVTTYLRNLVLNQSILVLALAAILLSPRLVVLVSEAIHDDPVALAGWALLFLAISLVSFSANLLTLEQEGDRPTPAYTEQQWVQLLVVLPLFIAAWLAGLWIWFAKLGPDQELLADWLAARWSWFAGRTEGMRASVEPLTWALLVAAAYTLVWLLAGLLVSLGKRLHGRSIAPRDRKTWAVTVAAAPIAGAVGGVLLWALATGADRFAHIMAPDGVHASWHLFHVNVWKAPLIVLIFLLAGFVHLGLVGRAFPESHRQWWSRLGAWLLIYALAWLGLFGTAVYAPLLVLWLGSALSAAAGVGWAAMSIAGVLIGRRVATPAAGAGQSPPILRSLVLALAPQVFIAGMLALVALGLHAALSAAAAGSNPCGWFWPPPEVGLHQIIACHSSRMWATTGPLDTPLLFAALTIAALLLSGRVDINQFSMHLFYRNRLIRAFLGASNAQRRPQPFTGFDACDDLPMASLSPQGPGGFEGPFAIWNTTLNLVSGEELAWQERKAASFCVTPQAVGFEVNAASGRDAAGSGLASAGYRPTAGYDQTEHGLTLGTAMGISGAAVSPNMGAATDSSLAFLLTLFNVRLGWWLGNPRRRRTWNRMGPGIGLLSLLAELFGMTHSRSRYVYLSDGGHFENLGVYELIRRRTRFVVAIDAGGDPDLRFHDLGEAIRKCRNDFGVEIEIDLGRVRRAQGAPFSSRHCAVGTIRYDRVDAGARPGTLVYLKASLTGDEDEDVLNYAAEHDAFPHEPTTDQWFGESQFESYRKLGEHIGEQTFAPLAEAPAGASTETLFAHLRQAWNPAAAGAGSDRSAQGEAHGPILATFDRLLVSMRSELAARGWSPGPAPATPAPGDAEQP